MMDDFGSRRVSELDAIHFLGSVGERDDVACDKPAPPFLADPGETEEPTAVRVLCAGANMLLYGIVGVLSEATPAEVTWVRSLHEVLRRAGAGERFDIVLLDTALADLGGFEGMKRATAALPQAAVVITSIDEDPSAIAMAIKAGARGYIPMSARIDVLRYALPLVLRGEFYVPASGFRGNALLQRGMPALAPADPSPGEAGEPPRPEPCIAAMLTRRQAEVLLLMAAGKSNKEIARDLDLINGTIKLHVKSILRKLGVHNRTQAVMAAARAGYLPKHLVGP